MDAFDEHAKYIVTSVMDKQIVKVNEEVKKELKKAGIEVIAITKPPKENEDYRISLTDFEFSHIFKEDDIYAIIGIMTQNHLPKITHMIVKYFKEDKKAKKIELSDIVYEYYMERQKTHKIGVKFTYKIFE